MLRTSPRTLALAFASAALAGCSVETANDDPASFPDTPYATVTSEAGALTLAVRTSPSQPPTRGRIAVEYTVIAGPAEELDLEVIPWMPAMGHGTSTTPVVEAAGGGRYRVTGVELFMPGRWELRTAISGAVTDHAIVSLQIP